MATATQTANLTGILGGLAFGFRDENGKIENSSNSLITSVTKGFKNTIPAPSGTYATLLTVSATVANASLAAIKNAVIVNKSTTLTARVGFVDDSAKAAYLELLPKSALFIDNENIETKADGSGFSAFTSINTISAAGVSGTPNVAVVAVGT